MPSQTNPYNQTIVTCYEQVPLTPDYTDVFWDPTGDAFKSWLDSEHKHYQFEKLSYQRLQSSVRFNSLSTSVNPRNPFTVRLRCFAEQIRKCNYMYILHDGETGGSQSQPYYAFITATNYISPQCTEVVYVIDWFHTWMDTVRINPSLVRREHITEAEDRQYKNREAEPITPVINDVDIDMYHKESMWIDPQICISWQPDGAILNVLAGSAKGQMYGGIFGSPFLSTYPATAAGAQAAQSDLSVMMSASKVLGGAGDIIRDVFMVPASVLSGDKAEKNTIFKFNEKNLNFHTKDGTYTARNRKLVSTLFCSICCASSTGSTATYSPDLWEQGQGEIRLIESRGTTTDALAYPANYDGIEDNVFVGVPYTEHIQTAWAAASGWGAVLSTLAKVGITVAGVSAAGAMGYAMANANFATPIEPGLVPQQMPESPPIFTTRAIPSSTTHTEISPFVENQKAVGPVSGPDLSIGPQLPIQRVPQFHAPNIAHGAAGGSGSGSHVIGAARLDGYVMYRRCPSIQDLERIDMFFDIYGYAVNRWKVPELNTRKNWNFVQLESPNIKVDGPIEALQTFRSVFSAGVKLWHNNTIGTGTTENPFA